jgi:hypothetical protein
LCEKAIEMIRKVVQPVRERNVLDATRDERALPQANPSSIETPVSSYAAEGAHKRVRRIAHRYLCISGGGQA